MSNTMYLDLETFGEVTLYMFSHIPQQKTRPLLARFPLQTFTANILGKRRNDMTHTHIWL